jgi:membrane-associated PAP2 superfamily phosphatase
MKIKQQILVTSLVLLASILFFGLSDVDMVIQDYFFHPLTHTWFLDGDVEPYHFLFYSGIKKLLILIAVGFLIALVFFRKYPLIQTYKKGIIIVILSAIFVPVAVGALKKTTNMPCPKNELHYGGDRPRTAVWQSYTPAYASKKKIACWPAGHASGGFALMSLFFLFKRRRNKYLALFFALVVGWSMGSYKMIIGDHFFSHTWITMLIAWLIILTIVALVDKKIT